MPIKQVDVSAKPNVYREATATGTIRLKPSTIVLIRQKKLEKGDAISLAEISAIRGVKETPSVVMLSHPLRIEATEPKVTLSKDSVRVTVRVVAHDKTGVEMEALTAVATALLNIWDVVKSYEKDERGEYPGTTIESLRVTKKVKGRG